MSEIRGTPAAMSECSVGCAVRREKERAGQSGLSLAVLRCAVWIEVHY